MNKKYYILDDQHAVELPEGVEVPNWKDYMPNDTIFSRFQWKQYEEDWDSFLKTIASLPKLIRRDNGMWKVGEVVDGEVAPDYDYDPDKTEPQVFLALYPKQQQPPTTATTVPEDWDEVLTEVPVRVHPMTESYFKNKFIVYKNECNNSSISNGVAPLDGSNDSQSKEVTTATTVYVPVEEEEIDGVAPVIVKSLISNTEMIGVGLFVKGKFSMATFLNKTTMSKEEVEFESYKVLALKPVTQSTTGEVWLHDIRPQLAEIDRLNKRVQELQDWKESAMKVMRELLNSEQAVQGSDTTNADSSNTVG